MAEVRKGLKAERPLAVLAPDTLWVSTDEPDGQDKSWSNGLVWIDPVTQPFDLLDPGKSAYQVAVDQGFTGTEAEWVTSLQGTPNVVRLTADRTNSTVTLADATGLAIPVAANEELAFEFLVAFTTAVTTTGILLALNGPASPVLLAASIRIPISATTQVIQSVSTYNAGPLGTGVDVANAPRMAEMRGVFKNGPTAGSLIVRYRSEVAGSAVVVKAGSSASWY